MKYCILLFCLFIILFTSCIEVPTCNKVWIDVGTLVSVRYLNGGYGACSKTEITTTKGIFLVIHATKSVPLGCVVKMQADEQLLKFIFANGSYKNYKLWAVLAIKRQGEPNANNLDK